MPIHLQHFFVPDCVYGKRIRSNDKRSKHKKKPKSLIRGDRVY